MRKGSVFITKKYDMAPPMGIGVRKLFALLFFAVIACSALSQAVFAQAWTAQWIWQSADGPSDTWMCFRKTFSLSTVPASAPTRISADSKYWLYVNDSLVVREGNLKRGPTPTGGYYDSLDLAPYLASGSNMIAVLVDYWGVNGFSHKSSGKGGLLFQMNAGGTIVNSDATWKARQHPSFGRGDPTQVDFRISERDVIFDASVDIPTWYTKNFSDVAWSAATEKGIPPIAPWGVLVRRPIPFWKDYGVFNYTNNASFHLPRSDGPTLNASLPFNMQVQARFTVSSSTPGLLVTIPATLECKYRTRGDGTDETFEMPMWVSKASIDYDQIEYQFQSGITIKSISYRRTGYAAEVAGSFECPDSSFNTLWQKALRTLQVCIRDNYMDCPDRERAQWWGDAVVEIPQGLYGLDRSIDLLTAKAMRELMNWQRADKTIFSPVPAGNWDCELAIQMLASVGREGFWTYFMHSADTAVIRDVYPRVKDYVMSVWSMGGDGLVNHRETCYGHWTDAGENDDIKVLDNCWYYLALKSASSMAVLTGNTSDTAAYASRIRSIETNFDRVLWNPSVNAYYSPGISTNPDDRANAMAVVSGLAAKSRWPGIKPVLTSTMNAGTWMEKWVEEALFMMGEETAALARMKTRYLPMINSNHSTLTEGFPVEGTKNHDWSGGPLILLSQYVAGIAPETVGFSTFHVLPQMSTLSSVNASLATIHGQISTSLAKQTDGFTMKVVVPPGTIADLGVPVSFDNGAVVASVKANNSTVWPSGTLAGISFDVKDTRYLHFKAQPGTWTLVAGNGPVVGIDRDLSGARASKWFEAVLTSTTGSFQKARFALPPGVDCQEAKLTVYTFQGQVVAAFGAMGSSLVRLAPGRYLVRLRAVGFDKTAPVVIIR